MKKVIITFATVFFTAATALAQDTATFAGFLAQFPKATLPYTLGEEDLRTQLENRAANQPVAKAKRLAWEYYDFLPSLEADARDNRMPVYPEPIAAFENENYHAVVFNTGRNFARQYKTYNIAVFTKTGELVATRTIAGVNPTALASATIDANLNVIIKEYSVNWAKDYSAHGLEGNTIVNLILNTTRSINAATAAKNTNEDWKNSPVELVKKSTEMAQSK
jgi:hypothetical protein